MPFRKDINGLRAIAVIAVLIFHFNPTWMPGGFAGVDVFFVISGFLMTAIIFRGLERGDFSIWQFYVARANRIVPALAALCLALLVFAWFYLTPLDYMIVGKHVASSISFLSNITYWSESGYFDVVAREKWLLHTWSLSLEWQFYILYPILLLFLRSFMSTNGVKGAIVVGTIIGFAFSVFISGKWVNFSYYLLPTRVWEMMAGGVAYLYPLRLTDKNKTFMEWGGLMLIISSFVFISNHNDWPGYLALICVLGTTLVIQAQKGESVITGNIVFQKIGTWSYSIYLWHWPIVVSIHYFSLSKTLAYPGILLSIFLGFLSHRYIEKMEFKRDFAQLRSYLKCMPIYAVLFLSLLGGLTYLTQGFLKRAPSDYQYLVNEARPSPYRKKCDIWFYQTPAESCEYFGSEIEWATFGDSHSTEIAYALAKKLESSGVGLKHFSFAGCRPSYLEDENFSKCARWYNEALSYISENKKIKNVVFNHRFTSSLFRGGWAKYPDIDPQIETEQVKKMVARIDKIIIHLASLKENVVVFYPIPELPKDIKRLIGFEFKNNNDLTNIFGTPLSWYERKNRYIIDHFNSADYPTNVHLLKPQDAFCDSNNCFAVKNGVPLYFDDGHPSVIGASELVNLIANRDLLAAE